MKNKKKVLTVLFAAILAFIAVFFIFRFEHKKTEQVTPEQKIEEQNEILDTTEVKNKDNNLVGKIETQGTTPRRLTDLIGSLCDLTSGSGDKGTPVVYIQGYFDNIASE